MKYRETYLIKVFFRQLGDDFVLRDFVLEKRESCRWNDIPMRLLPECASVAVSLAFH